MDADPVVGLIKTAMRGITDAGQTGSTREWQPSYYTIQDNTYLPGYYGYLFSNKPI